MTSKAKEKDQFFYYPQLWLNTGTHMQVRLLKFAKKMMLASIFEPVDEYLVIYNHDLGRCESCDCPGFTMHRQKPNAGVHKHFKVINRWLSHKRPLFYCYSLTEDNEVKEHALIPLGDK